MLTTQQLTDYCSRLQLPNIGAVYLQQVRETAPARSVGGGRANVSGTVPSRKMRCTIQFESRTNELAHVYLFENDPTVLEFWDQPNPKIKLVYQLANGRNQSVWHTPDFFVLEQSACGWVECKTEQDLETLSIDSPNRYKKSNDGKWCCPPGEQVAAEHGFFYRLISADTIDRTLVSNFQYLDDYFRTPHEVATQTSEPLLFAVVSKPGILLPELREVCPDATPGDIFSLIATGRLYVDLSAFRLADEASKVRVFRDATLAKMLNFVDQHAATSGQALPQLHEGATVQYGARMLTVTRWHNGEILLTGDADLRIQEETIGDLLAKGEMTIVSPAPTTTGQRLTEFLSRCPEKALAEGHRRNAIFSDPKQFPLIPERTREHWRSYVRLAEADFGETFGWVGLIPRRFNCGRKALSLPQSVEDVMSTAFEEYENPKAITFSAFWCRAQAIAGERGVFSQLCCRKTAKAWLKAQVTLKTTEIREGATVAKSKAPRVPVVPGTTPHGRWPWERAYIDHTKVDVQLLLSDGTVLDGDKDETQRAWLSVMIDGYSRKVLAFVLDFNPPSNKSCMFLIRECVRKHRSLPKTLVLDGGKEFRSTYFRSLMANCTISAEYRPPRRPRFGAQIERWFGTANTKFFHQLLGNTKVMRNVRQVTQAVNPSHLAVWTLETLHEALAEFCYDLYNETDHSSLKCSPNAQFIAGVKEHDTRLERRFEYTEDFIKWTLPSTCKGVAKVTRDGIKVFNCYYYDPQMIPLVGHKLAVRYDPCDISRVYVLINKQWVWAKCGLHSRIAGMSEKQRELASKALRRQQTAAGQAADSSERKLGQFLGTVAGKEAVLEQHKKDNAIARIMAKSAPQPAAPDPATGVSPAPALNPPKPKRLPPRKDLPIYRVSEVGK